MSKISEQVETLEQKTFAGQPECFKFPLEERKDHRGENIHAMSLSRVSKSARSPDIWQLRMVKKRLAASAARTVGHPGAAGWRRERGCSKRATSWHVI